MSNEERSKDEEDPRVLELTKKIEDLKEENIAIMTSYEEQGKKFAEEKEEMRSEMKRISHSISGRVNINPKGCYSDSKTRKAKLAAKEAKKSKSNKD